jgi:hypothetical protein
VARVGKMRPVVATNRLRRLRRLGRRACSRMRRRIFLELTAIDRPARSADSSIQHAENPPVTGPARGAAAGDRVRRADRLDARWVGVYSGLCYPMIVLAALVLPSWRDYAVLTGAMRFCWRGSRAPALQIDR